MLRGRRTHWGNTCSKVQIMPLVWNSWMLFQCLYCWHKTIFGHLASFFNSQTKKSLCPQPLHKEKNKPQTFSFYLATSKKMWKGLLKLFITFSETFQIGLKKRPNFHFHQQKSSWGNWGWPEKIQKKKKKKKKIWKPLAFTRNISQKVS